jgi:fatty-acid desaturase
MNHNIIVRGLQILTHVLLVFGLFIDPVLMLYSVLIYWVIGSLGINVGFHRLIAHRSFQTYKWIEYTLALIGSLTTVGSPLAWVALHRQHHTYTETDKDPHSPYILGWWKAWFGFWDIKNIDTRFIKDLRKIKFYKLTHKYYLHLIVSYCCILALIDPIWIIYGWAIPSVLVLHSTSAIIVIAHKHGYKTFDLGKDQARNSWIASLITLGEGWHNNHHAHPRDWNNQYKWWEFDPPSWFIRLVKK